MGLEMNQKDQWYFAQPLFKAVKQAGQWLSM